MKMYCIVSKSVLDQINGIRGKLMTQGQHAILHAFWDAEMRYPELADAYKDCQHARKINLAVDSVEELEALRERYKSVCGVSLVTDVGFTVFKGKPTTTCLGIGPIREEDIGEDLRSLPLFK